MMMMHLVIALILLVVISKASESDPCQFPLEDDNSHIKRIFISPRSKSHHAKDKENVTQWGSSTSPPVSVFSGEDFDELYDVVEPKVFQSASTNTPANLSLSQTCESFCLSPENICMLEKVVSYSELKTINSLCTFLTKYFTKSEEAVSPETKRMNEEFTLGIMDRLLTIFDNITNRMENEMLDADQIDHAKKYMEKLRRDIHDMKYKFTSMKI